MAVSDNDARIIIGLLRRMSASTEAILDSITTSVASTTAIAALLTSQQTLLETLIEGLGMQEEIRNELIKINESIELLESHL